MLNIVRTEPIINRESTKDTTEQTRMPYIMCACPIDVTVFIFEFSDIEIKMLIPAKTNPAIVADKEIVSSFIMERIVEKSIRDINSDIIKARNRPNDFTRCAKAQFSPYIHLFIFSIIIHPYTLMHRAASLYTLPLLLDTFFRNPHILTYWKLYQHNKYEQVSHPKGRTEPT